MKSNPQPTSFINPSECREIANQYLQDCTPIESVVSELEKGGAYGQYIAGELLTEEAWRVRSYNGPKPEIASLLAKASNSFCKVPVRADDVSLRSQARQIQSMAVRSILTRDTLPSPQTTREMNHRLVEVGHVALNTLRMIGQTELDDKTAALFGFAAEMAILTLAQRHTIRESTTSEWLPLQSSFSEDHGGNCSSYGLKLSTPWDITIFTQYDRGLPPESTYQLQVKSVRYYKPGSQPMDTDSDVSQIILAPDFSLAPSGQKAFPIVSRILGAVQIERDNPEAAAERITPLLDRQTEILLDIID